MQISTTANPTPVDDARLAERRAAALSVDPALLSELLGKVEMRELLDPGIIAGMANEWDEQKVRGAWVSAEHPGWGRRDGGLPLSVLDAVSASELLRDLEHLRG